MLSEKSKVDEYTIQKVLYRDHGTIQFDTADRLICTIGYGGMFWNSREIRDIYRKVNLKYIDKMRPTKSPEYVTTVEIDLLLRAS
jgi:hypothetical protein